MQFNDIYVSILNMDVPAASQAPNLDCYFTHVEVPWVMCSREKTPYPMLFLIPDKLTLNTQNYTWYLSV